jgi:hypothetical protein
MKLNKIIVFKIKSFVMFLSKIFVMTCLPSARNRETTWPLILHGALITNALGGAVNRAFYGSQFKLDLKPSENPC